MLYVPPLQPGMEEGRNCYADEHYLPTLFHVSNSVHNDLFYLNLSLSLLSSEIRDHIYINQMMDPAGIANWSVTYVDWSEGKWHPRSFRAKDVTYERLKNMTVCVPFLYIMSLLMTIYYFFFGDAFNFRISAVH
jgi:hypothetical protein